MRQCCMEKKYIGRAHRKHRWLVVRIAAIFAILICISFGTPKDAFAFHKLNVTATVTKVSNRLNRCFDPPIFACSRPDYFAVISIEGTSKDPWVSCGFLKDRVNDRDTINPTGWTCSATLENPSVVVEIWDFDAPGAELADVIAGPGERLIVPATLGTNAIVTAGDDTDIVVVITATRQPSTLSPLSVSTPSSAVPPQFDPSLKETITISGAVDHKAHVRFFTQSTLGGADIGEINADGPFVFTWDGTYLGGNLAGVGLHSIVAAGEGGTPIISSLPPTSITTGIQIVKRPPNTLILLSSFPATESAPKWNPRAGPLR